MLSAHKLSLVTLVHQDQQAILRPVVKGTVADEVKDAVVVAPKLALEVAQRGPIHAFQNDQPALLQVADGFPQAVPLPVHVQCGIIAWAGNHNQHARGVALRRGLVAGPADRHSVLPAFRWIGRRNGPVELLRISRWKGCQLRNSIQA